MGCTSSYQRPQNNEIRTIIFDNQRRRQSNTTNDICLIQEPINEPKNTIEIPFNHQNQNIKQTINLKQPPLSSLKKYQQLQQIQVPTLQALLHSYDRRQKMNQKIEHPFNCIGCLYFSTKYQENGRQFFKQYIGTGFLIAPNIAITAAHYLDIYKKVGVLDMKFLISQYNDENFIHVCCNATKITKYQFSNNYDSINKQIDQDYGMVFLEHDIHRSRYLQIAANFHQNDVEAHIYGHPYETFKKYFNLIGMKGPIKSIDNRMIQYDIDTTMGQSGSPILIQYTNKHYVAIGIHLGKHDKDLYNSGCLITQQTVNHFQHWINWCQNKSNDDTRSTSKKAQFDKNCQYFSFIDLKKSSIRILDQLKLLKAQNETMKFILSITTKYQQRQSYLQPAEKSYLQDKHHQSLAYCEQGLNQRYLHLVEKFKILNLTGLNYFKLHQFELALYYYSESFELQTKLKIPDKNVLVKTLNNIGSAYVALDQASKARNFFFRSKKLRKEIQFQNEQEQLQILMSDGLVCLAQDNILKAYNLFKSAKALSFKQSSILTIEKAIILDNLADTTFKLRRIDEWLQFSFGCLWILKKLGLSLEPQYLNWYASFLKNVNNSLQKAQKCLVLKLARIWRILELKQSDLHDLIMSKIRNILNGSELVKIIQ